MSDPIEQVVRNRQTLGLNKEDRNRQSPHPTRAQEPVHPPAHGDDEERSWTAPQNLDAPPPRSGMVQRWIRVSMHGKDDPTNAYKADRDGWKPRKADTIPEGWRVPTIQHGEFAGVIGVHGMILCEAPERLMNQRKRYYEAQTERNTQAVARDLAKESNPMMPLHQQRESTVQTGRMRTPNVMADED